MDGRAYLSDLHSLSLVVPRPGSETSWPCSFTLSSNLACPARMWSAMVRSDNSQLWSRSASIIRICSPFDEAIESARKRRPRRQKMELFAQTVVDLSDTFVAGHLHQT